MPSDIRIFLVRHGESASNVDNSVNAKIADHMIPLSDRGHIQAEEAGRALRAHIDASGISDERFRLWRSPYLRTRQTADGLWKSVGNSLDIDLRESDLIREQEFGLFDGIPDEELPIVFPREHAQYKKHEDFEGRYFARMPMGESRCDVSQRVHQFFGSLHRDVEKHGIRNLIVVSHGVTIRCFVKEWLHLPYEWIEKERNPGNCSIRLIEGGEDLGYVFEGFKVKRVEPA